MRALTRDARRGLPTGIELDFGPFSLWDHAGAPLLEHADHAIGFTGSTSVISPLIRIVGATSIEVHHHVWLEPGTNNLPTIWRWFSTPTHQLGGQQTQTISGFPVGSWATQTRLRTIPADAQYFQLQLLANANPNTHVRSKPPTFTLR